MKSYPLAEELLTSDSYQQQESPFSQIIQPLLSWPCSSGSPHIQEYLGSTN